MKKIDYKTVLIDTILASVICGLFSAVVAGFFNMAYIDSDMISYFTSQPFLYSLFASTIAVFIPLAGFNLAKAYLGSRSKK